MHSTLNTYSQSRMELQSFVSFSPRLSEVDYLLLQVEQQLQTTRTDASTGRYAQPTDAAGTRILPCGAVEETSEVSSPSTPSSPPMAPTNEMVLDFNALRHYNELLAVLDGYEMSRKSTTTSSSSLGEGASLQFSNITKESSEVPRNGTAQQ